MGNKKVSYLPKWDLKERNRIVSAAWLSVLLSLK